MPRKPTGNPTGRPSTYSEDIGLRLCSLLASGEKTLKQICETVPGMPTYGTVMSWLTRARVGNEWFDFSQRYRRARIAQSHALADEALRLVQTTDATNYNANRVRIDGIKWAAAKLNPAEYGDYQRIEHSGAIEHKSPVDRAPDWLRGRIKPPAEAASSSHPAEESTPPTVPGSGAVH